MNRHLIVAGALMALGLSACDQATTDQTRTAGYVGATGHAVDARRFTKTEFSNYAFNRTKAQIRAEFGSPDVVQDGTDSWTYTSLAVFDADAGTRAQIVTIQFAGLSGPDDFVADVSF